MVSFTALASASVSASVRAFLCGVIMVNLAVEGTGRGRARETEYLMQSAQPQKQKARNVKDDFGDILGVMDDFEDGGTYREHEQDKLFFKTGSLFPTQKTTSVKVLGPQQMPENYVEKEEKKAAPTENYEYSYQNDDRAEEGYIPTAEKMENFDRPDFKQLFKKGPVVDHLGYGDIVDHNPMMGSSRMHLAEQEYRATRQREAMKKLGLDFKG
eukprot:CAMPEP_0197538610 /NCGR_PEP_ID=MMETSP1318-20131121/60152_1 /TAXON_ID=552666 /ORGANISM="Partenskyella glossopodia, Strain RCC365" /LENGTH=212 /DNA_ID=CAMNT_0043097073 /DNA_START=116 /DNA_END=751 /DNA_ORIENTATION=-